MWRSLLSIRSKLLASWNFHHLVNVKARRLINLVNALLGHGQIEIVSPPEL